MPKITEQQIYEIMASELMLSVDELNIDAPIGAYQIDSLHLHEFSLLIDEHYGVHFEFNKNAIGEIYTIKDVAKYVLRVTNDAN
jgi:acyl carrier protein